MCQAVPSAHHSTDYSIFKSRSLQVRPGYHIHLKGHLLRFDSVTPAFFWGLGHIQPCPAVWTPCAWCRLAPLLAGISCPRSTQGSPLSRGMHFTSLHPAQLPSKINLSTSWCTQWSVTLPWPRGHWDKVWAAPHLLYTQLKTSSVSLKAYIFKR